MVSACLRPTTAFQTNSPQRGWKLGTILKASTGLALSKPTPLNGDGNVQCRMAL